MPPNDVVLAIDLMDRFARRTGLTSDAAPVRYLWTDAFAVGNFLALAALDDASRFESLALRTVDQVHGELGHFRHDDERTGWLSGPHGAADTAHPTRAGLRIGKLLPERGREQPFDEQLEWERDGQYFHYLTRWMDALDQVARRRGEARFNLWARELADTAHRAFTRTDADGPRMVWKMSTDLSRALVPSMGQHDPLDGLVTAITLRATAVALHAPPEPDLHGAIADYAAMLSGTSLTTVDPLGLGGLLADAWRLVQHRRDGDDDIALLDRVLEASLTGLQHYRTPGNVPADARLAFRELGLAIGLAAIEQLATDASIGRLPCGVYRRRLIAALQTYRPVREAINAFWRQAANRRGPTWDAHRDINDVMLATSLVKGSLLSS